MRRTLLTRIATGGAAAALAFGVVACDAENGGGVGEPGLEGDNGGLEGGNGGVEGEGDF